MSFVNVSASFVQKDCLAIIKWWERKKETISTRYLRFQTHLGWARKRICTWNWRHPLRWFFSNLSYPCDHHCGAQYHRWLRNSLVFNMRVVQENTYVDNAHRLLAACERVLAENSRLKDPGISLSSEDAEWLKKIMPQTKEKL